MPGLDTKQRIYQAARRLFYDNGFAQTTVANIIDASETNKGSFYHHFEDKQHLAYNIYMEMVKAIDAAVAAVRADDAARIQLIAPITGPF